jgi:tetratricopeptide (TPR) repeat protein
MNIRFGMMVGFLAVFLLVPNPAAMRGQDQTAPQEKKEVAPEPVAVDADEAARQMEAAKKDVGYTKEEYEEFQKALTNPDVVARCQGLFQFLKAHPNSKLNEHIVGNIPPLLNQLYQEKKMSELGPLAEEFLKYKPEDLLALGVATEAFYTSKNYDKAALFGEILYGKKPTAQVAQLLAHCFLEMKNDAKFASFAEKALAEMDPKAGFFFSAKLSYYYAERKDIPRAAQYCQKMLAAFGEGEIPPGYNSDNWGKEKARSYAIMARNLYERKQYGQAVTAYNNSLKFFKQNDEAYYYLGMCYWQMQDTTTAMKQFAKAVSINKNFAKSARNYLEGLYKATHSGSLDGIENLLRTASGELN